MRDKINQREKRAGLSALWSPRHYLSQGYIAFHPVLLQECLSGIDAGCVFLQFKRAKPAAARAKTDYRSKRLQ